MGLARRPKPWGAKRKPNVPGSVKRARAAATMVPEPTEEMLDELGDQLATSTPSPGVEVPDKAEYDSPPKECEPGPAPEPCYTEQDLLAMRMKELRELGKKYDVPPAKTKSALVTFILEAQS